MILHPAYPTAIHRHRGASVNALVAAEIANNQIIAAALADAAARLREARLDGYSLIPGYDLADVSDALAEMMPLFDASQTARLIQWAWERTP